jgi:hypothetical protein
MADQRKGLSADILHPRYSSSNGGISEHYHHVVITDVRSPFDDKPAVDAARRGQATIPHLFYPGDTTAEVHLVVRNIPGHGLYVHAEPAEGAGTWAMFGGAYITTSDARFDQILHAIHDYTKRLGQLGPIPLHDRYER